MKRIERTYTEEIFKEAVLGSTCVREVLTKLNIVAEGGNYRQFYQTLKKWPVSTKHFVGKSWSKGVKLPPRRDLDDYLNNRFPIQSAKLKQKLFSEGVFIKQCGICGLVKWNKLSIPLELDHINGNHMDNTLSNLRVICPNCHAQTDTYRGKNISKSPSPPK